MVDATTAKNSSGGDSLQLVLRHRVLPLEIQTRSDAWGQCGVITRRLTLVNRGANPLHVASAPSLSWRLPAGEYELTTLQGSWGAERQVVTNAWPGWQRPSNRRMGVQRPRNRPGLACAIRPAGCAISLSWPGQATGTSALERANTNDIPMREELLVTLGARFDYGGAALLPAGDSLETAGGGVYRALEATSTTRPTRCTAISGSSSCLATRPTNRPWSNSTPGIRSPAK